MSYIKTKITHFFKLVFPSTYTELAVFLFFIVCYGILGSYIALHYRIIFDNRIPWDAYFSFDNRSILMTGGSFERHPLSYYFFNWIREFSLFISGGKMDANFRLTLAWLSNIIITLNIVQIFKYLKNIIQLPLWLSLLIIMFFGTFSTNIILSFTPENFTYTLFLLSLYNYYAAIKLRKEEKIPATALSLAGITIGGLTITNFVKVFIPLIFEKGIFTNWKKFGNAAIRVAVAIICFVLLYLNRIDFNYQNIFSKTNQQYEKFSNVNSMPTWDMILSFFFGGNILFPGFIMSDKHNMKGFNFKGLYMDLYSSPLPYFFIAILLILISWSYIKNFKNKWVQVIAISFLADIVIHCVMRFGLHTSYIYGGHFVFAYPLLLGWLFFAYRSSPKIMSFLTATVLILFVYLLANNIFRMTEFFWFMENYYQ
ncbi:hypothetical protein J2795_002880 [Chryseobacterium bernardetii]|uniref:Dolichyl-phosphate-mannose-protein mannosyltransferase n=2 Tax=Chryseobacterium TaxID=59732 RepID=A0A543EBV0_9FLAO|nr:MULTISPECIES: DUF6080 domain-containing protein [Chryseobacterium]MDR6371333.1 hypothetical protein [Chryseobacterium vietnamense]MDR6442162.1 hypothetical protein [Chryseobacterium bernardetii]TQM19040.1 hypothetical protein FB551_3435 [Chryseobacterium aquifrigidense]